ncbi:MAG: V-type ATP synthase subunit D [Candidatus Anoxychlamydiales bacterium]|nr:V-type ATP synthase subunit D [Candidatus Anoxychlamydiales bacterium]
MADFKMTKNGLRSQELLLKQLNNYLPTLQLKKTLLQVEVNNSKAQINTLLDSFNKKKEEIYEYSHLLSLDFEIDPTKYLEIKHIDKTYENIAGVELAKFQKILFSKLDYFLFDSSPWTDSIIEKLKELIELKEKINIEKEKYRALKKELIDVSIRVNLFEKILIPKTLKNIKKIKIFLSDQELAAISQAKVAKLKIEKAKQKL